MTDDIESSPKNGFIVEAPGPPGMFGVFEDDGTTGYLYTYEPDGEGVITHLRIYTCAPTLSVQEDDVNVEWSRDLSKCGVRIWGKMRGIIDLASKNEGRVLLENRDTPGLGDPQWLAGF